MINSLHEDVKKIKAESMILGEKINALAGKGLIPKEEIERLRGSLNIIDLVLSKYKT
jgi:hypothetical protein